MYFFIFTEKICPRYLRRWGEGGLHIHTRKKQDLESCEIRKYQENLNLKTS